jgi:hypothetical protein
MVVVASSTGTGNGTGGRCVAHLRGLGRGGGGEVFGGGVSSREDGGNASSTGTGTGNRCFAHIREFKSRRW